MSYKITTNTDNIVVDATTNKLALTVNPVSYAVALSRTGGQGSKGDSVSNAFINANNELIIEVLSSSGEVTAINSGTLSFDEFAALTSLSDVQVTTPQEGDVLLYEAATSNFVNHQLTTSKLLDVDNSAVSDGALLLYNGTTTKYTATTILENPNTVIKGGNY